MGESKDYTHLRAGESAATVRMSDPGRERVCDTRFPEIIVERQEQVGIVDQETRMVELLDPRPATAPLHSTPGVVDRVEEAGDLAQEAEDTRRRVRRQTPLAGVFWLRAASVRSRSP
jgi:hypothetical protein